MITSQRIQTVIDTLKKALGRPVDMEATCAEFDDKFEYCGTPACVAGHYAIASHQHRPRFHSFNPFMPHPRGGHLLSYQSGANWMAEDLGFADSTHLEAWANDNPCLWGNIYGHNMFKPFSSSETYGGKCGDEITMAMVVKHWEGVRDRVQKEESAET